MQKLNDKQKKIIQNFKDSIINSDSAIFKYRKYILLIRYLKKNLKIAPKEYKNNITIDYKIENSKISAKDTIIFSFGTALICYSALKGYCQLYKNKKCYALRNELQYNTSILYKHRQYKQLNNMKAWQLARQFIKIKKLYPSIKLIRLNESADCQKKHMPKINKIADIMQKYNVKIYTYTHNIELQKSDIKSKNLTINSSNKNIRLSNRFLSFDSAKINRIMKAKKDKKIILCPADCSKCKACTFNANLTILCKIH